MTPKHKQRAGIGRRALLAGVGLAGPALLSSRTFAQTGGGVVIKRLDWAGVRVECGEAAAYIDAVAPQGEAHAGSEEFASTRRLKYGLVTHGHGDHFDIDFLRRMLGERGVVFCQRAVAGDIDARVLRVQPVDLWEPVFMPRSGADMVGFATPAVDGFGLAQTSWVLRCGDKRIIHCGDTVWHGEFWDIGRALGPFDVACLPINGARQNIGRFQDLGAPGVLTPQQAVAAARALGAGLIVPIHYGSTDDPNYIETPHALQQLREEARRYDIGVRALERGEEMTL
ncbi:MAG: MBL fold metallo-hydrolase [Hyphomonadaceae bacterium]